ncbi:MAG: penicillin-binding protein 1C [Halocynthiibacter sp.]
MRRLWLFVLAATLFGAAALRDGLDQWVAATDLPSIAIEVSSEVLARDGTLLRAYTVADGRWRLATSIEDVDPVYLEMLIAYEDQRFYDHSGVDVRALVRAAGQALWSREIRSGGSSLTMQAARLLENSGTRRWRGKLRQIRLALALERRLSKQQILTLYLNRAPFGGNIEGVRAATRAWFGKEPRRLTPAEAALLVALPQSPERRRPDRFVAAARAARDRVLARAGAIGVLDLDTVLAARTELVPVRRLPFPALAPHLADRALAANPGKTIYRLTVDAALQSSLQQLALEALARQAEGVSIAIVVADHTSGEVLASVGSGAYRADARQRFIDMTRALRSPGSTLKPLVYGLAFEEGLVHPESLIEDRPVSFGTYAPQNFDGQYRGTLRVREALQQSLNIPVVRLLDALGPAKLLARMRRAGMTPVVPGGRPGLAVGLGGVGVTLEDLVTLYAAFGQGGRATVLRWRQPDPVEDANLDPNSPEIRPQVLAPVAAWQVANILSGLPPPLNAPENGLAYKTGTSYGYRDAWAVGFDGRHVAGVWLGRPDGAPVPGAFGGAVAAPVLFDVFARLKPTLDPLPPPPPETLIVSTAALPAPLRRFRSRIALFAPDASAPQVAFPPDGAVLDPDGGLLLRVRDGAPPFTWLVNGRPVAIATRERQTLVALAGPGLGPGFLRLSVIDARGRSARADVTIAQIP